MCETNNRRTDILVIWDLRKRCITKPNFEHCIENIKAYIITIWTPWPYSKAVCNEREDNYLFVYAAYLSLCQFQESSQDNLFFYNEYSLKHFITDFFKSLILQNHENELILASFKQSRKSFADIVVRSTTIPKSSKQKCKQAMHIRKRLLKMSTFCCWDTSTFPILE